MLFDLKNNEIKLSLDELISYSFPCGSLVREKEFFEKPKLALSICESIADKEGRFMQCHSFSAKYEHGGFSFTIDSAPDLSSIHNDYVEIINVKASGGKRNASPLLISAWQRTVACQAAIAADSLGISKVDAKLLYSFDARYPADEINCAESYEIARAVLDETIQKATRLIRIHTERRTNKMRAVTSSVLVAHLFVMPFIFTAPTSFFICIYLRIFTFY